MTESDHNVPESPDLGMPALDTNTPTTPQPDLKAAPTAPDPDLKAAPTDPVAPPTELRGPPTATDSETQDS